MTATIINAIAVLCGTIIGLILKKNISSSFKNIVMLSSGVVTLVLGLQMAFEVPSAIAVLFSLLLGGFAGFALKIEDRIMVLGNIIGGSEGSSDFGKGFLNASLLFCTGSMSIVGAIEAGTTGGVGASVITIIVYQGFFTLLGGWIEPVLGEAGIAAMSAAGGFLLIFLALGLLGIKQIQTGNFLPALVLAPVIQYLYSLLPL